jgi:hypothetical protein
MIYKIFNNIDNIVMNYIIKSRIQIPFEKDPEQLVKYQEGLKIQEISDVNYKKLYDEVKDFNIIKSQQESLGKIYVLLENDKT